MDDLDKALIDKHFQAQEITRFWGPSGIYLGKSPEVVGFEDRG